MFNNNQEIKKRQRGRPKKVLTQEQILALQNKIKRDRGRPRKVISPEELRAIEERWQRSGGKRGRPRKILTPEQEMLKELKKQRGRGRPKKKLTAQEEWALKIKFNSTRGRPTKDYVVLRSLPTLDIKNVNKQVNFVTQNIDFQKEKLEAQEKLIKQESVKLENSNQKIKEAEKEAKKPTLSWDDFKQKFNLADFGQDGQDYIFSIQENKPSVNDGSKITKVTKVNLKDIPSLYVLDLRKQIDSQLIKDNKADMLPVLDSSRYAWEEKHPEKNMTHSLVDFDVPVDLDENNFKLEMTKIPKTRMKNKAWKLKPNLINQKQKEEVKKTETRTLSSQTNWLDKFLINFGKTIYSIWKILASPFKFLDFVVDKTLKAIWVGIRFAFNLIFKALVLNYSYLKKLDIFLLFKPLAIQNRNLKINIKKPILGFIIILLLIISPIVFLNTLHKIERTKGAVLGVSLQGVDNLKQASENLKDKDFNLALLSFSVAQENFKQAKFQIKNFGSTTNLLLAFVPEYKNSEKILRAGELSSSLGIELSKALQVFENNQAQTPSQTFCSSLPGKEQKCTAFSDLNLSYKVGYLKNSLNAQKLNIEELIEIIENIDLNLLPKNEREKIKIVQENIQNFKNSFNEFEKMLNFLYEFLGGDKPKRYLVVFQNSNELRATGGFMGSFALVDVFEGNVEKMEIPGGGLYDLKAANKIAVEAPKPLQIFSPYWQIWNANWSPDYKVSAEKIKWFYENLTSGSSIDGVISITNDVVEDLINQTGQVELLDYEKILTSDNFTEQLQMAVEIEYDRKENKPKKIITDLAPILLERLINLDTEKSLDVLLALDKSLQEKKILLYFNDEGMQKIVQDFNWSGEIRNLASNQDYLMVVHTNISGSKTDGVIDNKVEHKIEIQPNGLLLATVTLTRKHNGNPDDIFESANNVDYVRFYAPLGSKFVSATGFNFSPEYLFKYVAQNNELLIDKTLEQVEKNVSIDEMSKTRISQELDKTVFGNWIQVSPGKEQTAQIKYKLPFNYNLSNQNNFSRWLAKIFGKKEQIKYSLIVEKQAGMNEVDFSSQLIVPADYQVIDSAASSNLDINGDKIEFKSNLLRDGYWGVVLE